METQFEANADTKIGSAVVEHLHWNKSVLPKGYRADILVLSRPQKRTLFKKVRSSVRYLKATIFNCKGLPLYYMSFSVTIRLAVFIVGRKGKR